MDPYSETYSTGRLLRKAVMVSVLIVEDEILARLGLRQLIDWEKHGYRLIGEAADGSQAMAMIRKSRPDIILLDIEIPQMNGLEILSAIREEKINSRVIVISCHEEFGSVREAMKLGTFDYLRKLDLSEEELLITLDKCMKPAERAPEAKDNDEGLLYRHKLPLHVRYDDLIIHSGLDIFKDGCVFSSVICIIIHDMITRLTVSESVSKWIREMHINSIQIEKGTQYVYYALAEKRERSVFRQLYSFLSGKQYGNLYIGVTEHPAGNVQELTGAIALAEQILYYSYYDSDCHLTFFDTRLEPKTHSPREVSDLLDKLRADVQSFNRAQTEEGIHAIFSLIKNSARIQINVLRRIFMDMLGIYSMIAQSLNGSIEEVSVCGDNCHYQHIMTMNSMNDIEAWFIDFSEAFYQKYFIPYKCAGSDILRQVFEYINKSIERPVHLREAAEYVNLSGTYLSTLFKRETGRNFVDYVNELKMKKACEMLKEGRLVYEVSEALGYEDVTYFSKLFKRYENMPPEAFRRDAKR
jgi:two-component system response regulator YesN